jgi:hypothetical protein
MSQELIDFSAQIDEQFVMDDCTEENIVTYFLSVFN